MSDKPTVFIASSSEAISVSEAVHIKLDHEVRPNIWNNAFDISTITITSLIEQTKTVDYAVFVFHPDDKIFIREEEYNSVRDNVILELGMFIGALGLDKCFILAPQEKGSTFRIPSDLAGVTISFYDSQEPDITNAVTASCAKIKQRIKSLEASKKTPEAVSELETLKNQLSSTQSRIWSLNHDIQRISAESQSFQESIKSAFFSIVKPATQAEIKTWEEGAKESQLKDIKIKSYKTYFADQDVIIPSLTGADSISLIVGVGVKVYGVNQYSHNSIYYMDGFRVTSLD